MTTTTTKKITAEQLQRFVKKIIKEQMEEISPGGKAVFIVLDDIDYEGNDIIGVFSSLNAAKKYAKQHAAEGGGSMGGVSIQKYILDQPPESRWSEDNEVFNIRSDGKK